MPDNSEIQQGVYATVEAVRELDFLLRALTRNIQEGIKVPSHHWDRVLDLSNMAMKNSSFSEKALVRQPFDKSSVSG